MKFLKESYSLDTNSVSGRTDWTKDEIKGLLETNDMLVTKATYLIYKL